MALGSLGEVAYDIVAKDKTGPGLDSASEKAKKAGKITGAAMTGVGVGLTLMTDEAKKMNAPIRQTALQLGITDEAVRNLALDTANVTFPLKEVTATMDLLTRAGMEDVEKISEVATVFDTLGDATDKSASEVAGVMIPALNAFGIPLEDAAKHTDILTHLSRNTTVGLDEFSSMVNYLAADLGTMDITMLDSVAVMEALADKGITGSAATREFRTAVSEADGDVGLFYEALGLTEDKVGDYSDKISASEGITQDFADAANTQYGAVDDVKHGITELTLKYGSMLEPLDALGPAMTTLGPIMIAASSMNWGMVAPLMAHAAAALAAIAPYLLIIAPIVAVVAILYVLEKKFGVVTKVVELAREGFGKAVAFLKGIFTRAIEGARDIVGIFGDKLLFLLGPIGAVIYAIKNWEEIWTFIKGLFDRIFSFFSDIYGKFKEAGKNIMQALIDGIKSLISKPKELIEDALGSIADMLPFSPAKIGPLSEAPDWESYLIDPLKAVKISPEVMFHSMSPTAATPSPTGASRSPIAVMIEATIYNYSDIENLEQMIGEAVNRGIHDKYGMR